MSIGEKIKENRKKKNMSQEQFAEIFNITRQTVSNWENGKSYPDLEVILKISDFFEVSTDELLKKDISIVKKIDSEKKKNKKLAIGITALALFIFIMSVSMFIYVRKINSISFSMEQEKTIKTNKKDKKEIEIDTGYFNLPKNGKVNINTLGEVDSGELLISIEDLSNEQEVYQIKGDNIKDNQTIALNQSSYKIQIKADNYKENIISIDYKIQINNK